LEQWGIVSFTPDAQNLKNTDLLPSMSSLSDEDMMIAVVDWNLVSMHRRPPYSFHILALALDAVHRAGNW
jgi:hypothetical protein